MGKGRKKISIDEVKKRIHEKHGASVFIVENTYIGAANKATFIHNIAGSWEDVAFKVMKGKTHPRISLSNRKISIGEIKDRLFKVHGTSVSIIEDTYKGTCEIALFNHFQKGVWPAIVNNVLNGSSHTDFYTKPYTISQIEERIKRVHGDKVTIVKETYRNTHEEALFNHIEKGKWWAIVKGVLEGGSHTDFRPTKLTQQEVEDRIAKVHGDKIKIVWDTYISVSDPATFYHIETGFFTKTPEKVFSGQGPMAARKDKIKATLLRKYGVEYLSQHKEIGLKMAKSSNNCIIKNHWKTGEELVCQASYESKTVDYLNNNKTEFDWQPKTFKMPNGKTYRPDLFLINENKWIEIKGFMRKDAQEKWDWFQSQYPNSELWDKSKLKSLGIL